MFCHDVPDVSQTTSHDVLDVPQIISQDVPDVLQIISQDDLQMELDQDVQVPDDQDNHQIVTYQNEHQIVQESNQDSRQYGQPMWGGKVIEGVEKLDHASTLAFLLSTFLLMYHHFFNCQLSWLLAYACVWFVSHDQILVTSNYLIEPILTEAAAELIESFPNRKHDDRFAESTASKLTPTFSEIDEDIHIQLGLECSSLSLAKEF
nr:2339_t:CDS:2 [Entrophospora candida]